MFLCYPPLIALKGRHFRPRIKNHETDWTHKASPKKEIFWLCVFIEETLIYSIFNFKSCYYIQHLTMLNSLHQKTQKIWKLRSKHVTNGPRTRPNQATRTRPSDFSSNRALIEAGMLDIVRTRVLNFRTPPVSDMASHNHFRLA